MRRVVLQVEETSAYCTVNHRASASNYQLSNMKRPARDSNRWPQRLEARTLTTTPPSPLSAAFEQLNRCLEDVKEWMSTSNLKLNPDKTEFIIFGSKRQVEKLKACIPIDILDIPHYPVDSIKNLRMWFDSDFSLSKHVQNVCKSCFVKLHDFRHVSRFLYLWLLFLLEVCWITATHFSGASPSSIYVNTSVSKIVQPELYQTPVDTPV